MKVSIIIPSYNEEDQISDCLTSLNKQTHSDFEVIVVDDGSSDSTIQRAESVDTDYKLVILKQKHLGPATARNLGASKAKGKILVFVDADMSFKPDFLNKLTAPIENKKAKGTNSCEERVSNWENVWARCWNYNLGYPKKSRLPENCPEEQVVFRAILKSEFDRVEGFDTGGYTDDYTLADKLGYKALNVSGAVLYHINPDTISDIYKSAKWASKREYKLGLLGVFITILRASIPFSLLIGLYKSVRYREPLFLVFKIIYDTATVFGIIEYYLLNKSSK